MTNTETCDATRNEANTTALVLKIDAERVADSLRAALIKLDGSQGEAVLDFAAVRRVDAPAVRALEELARAAAARSIKIALRGVNVEIYKVLKLMNLAPRFSFS